MKEVQQDVGDKVRVGCASQRVDPYGVGVGGIDHDDISLPGLVGTSQDVVDQIAFRVNDDYATALCDVLKGQVCQQGRLAHSGRTKDVQMAQRIRYGKRDRATVVGW
ncbi:MAG: hypothetical protein V9G13_08025 [Marmoricola sp.]